MSPQTSWQCATPEYPGTHIMDIHTLDTYIPGTFTLSTYASQYAHHRHICILGTHTHSRHIHTYPRYTCPRKMYIPKHTCDRDSPRCPHNPGTCTLSMHTSQVHISQACEPWTHFCSIDLTTSSLVCERQAEGGLQASTTGAVNSFRSLPHPHAQDPNRQQHRLPRGLFAIKPRFYPLTRTEWAFELCETKPCGSSNVHKGGGKKDAAAWVMLFKYTALHQPPPLLIRVTGSNSEW